MESMAPTPGNQDQEDLFGTGSASTNGLNSFNYSGSETSKKRRQKKLKRTGRHTVEPSGRDISRMIANAEEPDVRSREEVRHCYKNGASLARKALKSAVQRAEDARNEEYLAADPDNRSRDEAAADQAYAARIRTIHDSIAEN